MSEEEAEEAGDDVGDEARPNESENNACGDNLVRQTQDNNDNTCTICMEEWTVGGEHRICCLVCGHLFGRKCIEYWIKEKGANAKCPICNKLAKKSHVRDLWVKSIKARDNSDLAELTQLLENERRLRKTDSNKMFNLNTRIEFQESQLLKLKKVVLEREARIAKLESVLDSNVKRRRVDDDDNSMPPIINLDCEDTVVPAEIKGTFHWVKKIESSPSGGCRSIAISPTNSVILVTQPAPTRSIFDDFGIRKYSLVDPSIREFIPLHKKIINALDLRSVGDLIITASQDKQIRITSINNNICIQNYNCLFDPVAVAWSVKRDQQFYVATGNRFVQLYDMRNTSEHVCESFDRISDTRPLSIASTSEPDGIIVNDIRGSHFMEISQESDYDLGVIDREANHFTYYPLPIEGQCMGTVDYNANKNLALISCRRSCAHHLLRLRKELNEETNETVIRCVNVKTFDGGRGSDLLSHSKIIRHPTIEDCVLVGAWDGDAQGIKLWDSSDNSVFQTIKTNSFIRDMAMYTPDHSNQHVLYTLGDKDIEVYRWDFF